MEKLRKITVQVPRHLLESAQAYTGEGVTQTVRTALIQLASNLEKQQALTVGSNARI